uniref:DDE Tnp4 domain-containing protein n=1 Tax=Panagrellus redivivus TaxID=6233 RepID=A0A7E4W2I9_PANRE
MARARRRQRRCSQTPSSVLMEMISTTIGGSLACSLVVREVLVGMDGCHVCPIQDKDALRKNILVKTTLKNNERKRLAIGRHNAFQKRRDGFARKSVVLWVDGAGDGKLSRTQCRGADDSLAVPLKTEKVGPLSFSLFLAEGKYACQRRYPRKEGNHFSFKLH